ncbi:MliC family protein [Luteimonas sp. S4-F44]|uniref:MliC family protein n=1 Tax=Luteimonas sp. S4-F44 TaxID=2925842 RepID=UPI001F537222|nr:MliC family protein [Luteimonas sp. S4-F44]UNK41193.1 MliC family protein [Luteimonas sp. S4-F44]
MRHAALPAALIGLALAACSNERETSAPPASPPPAPATMEAPPPTGSLAAREAESAPPSTVRYRCGDHTYTVAYEDDGDTALMQVDGRTLSLRTTPAASGARYADDAGNVLWTKGSDEADITVDGAPAQACRTSVEDAG